MILLNSTGSSQQEVRKRNNSSMTKLIELCEKATSVPVMA